MKGLIRASLNNPHAVIVMSLAIAVLGALSLMRIPIDILPVFKSPAVQVLTFYGGMPARAMEKDITINVELFTGQANGMKRQESRSIQGASIVRNYFHGDQNPSGALTQVNSLALAVIPQLPPGTLPPVVLPFDPTSTTPVALVTLDSKTHDESILYDVARYEVRNYIMQQQGAVAPVVIGGKIRAVMLYLDGTKMQARKLSPREVMDAVNKYNLFFASGDVRIGKIDYALSSNSMFDIVRRMGEIPVAIPPSHMPRSSFGEKGGSESQRTGGDVPANFVFLHDLADASDASFIQTNVVRVDGKRQVYIPVYRQLGASTLAVVDNLKDSLPDMKSRLSTPGIDLKVVMDQSVYVRASVSALVQEGTIGAILCSLVILLFLGQWRMTLIAIITLPLSVLVGVACLLYFGQTINVMTLAGLTLAIGPMIDSAIICLENTHRHLDLGATPPDAAFRGASEVAMPELVSTLCTFLVLSPLALMPGMGRFLFLPMTLAVMFTMTSAYLLSRTLVPCASAYLLSSHHDRASAKPQAGLQGLIDRGIEYYVMALNLVLRHKKITIVGSFSLLALTLVILLPVMRRDFFPEVDSGAFEIAARAPAGTRIEETEKLIEQVENYIKEMIPKEPEGDLELIVSELGLTADWSAAYTTNSGTMDAVLKVQLSRERKHTAQHYIRILREGLAKDPRFESLEFSFDSGGLVRSALNEGASSPLNIQILGKDQDILFAVADKVQKAVAAVDGVVDARVIQRPNAPELTLVVDRAKAAFHGLSQDDIMKSVIAATNSSISYNKNNFWIDSRNGMQYFVGVQYRPEKFKTKQDVLNIPITSRTQDVPIPLWNVATIKDTEIPTEVHHVNLQSAIDVTMNVEGRDLGHVSEQVAGVLAQFGQAKGDAVWDLYDPDPAGNKKILEGCKIVLTGEYTRMQDTFRTLATGLILASLLIYFLMVALDRSFIVPLAVMLIVPLCLIGILPVLYITGSAINVQSLLGFIFIIGIKVANTVLMTDCAQELRRHDGLSPLEAIRKAASLRVRPVTMTALAAFFAMIPSALAWEHGSEANAPLARAILGGLLAGEPATLFVLPALYAVMVRDKKKRE
jgi:multidrug efflux pump subunit AcrB